MNKSAIPRFKIAFNFDFNFKLIAMRNEYFSTKRLKTSGILNSSYIFFDFFGFFIVILSCVCFIKSGKNDNTFLEYIYILIVFYSFAILG